jgi:hypothetical protein
MGKRRLDVFNDVVVLVDTGRKKTNEVVDQMTSKNCVEKPPMGMRRHG